MGQERRRAQEFRGLGKNAAAGFLEGFRTGGLTGGLVDAVKKAMDGVRKFGREGSPWGLTEDMGKNAAVGFVQGFRWKLRASWTRCGGLLIRHAS